MTDIKAYYCKEVPGDPEFCSTHPLGIFDVGEKVCDRADDGEVE